MAFKLSEVSPTVVWCQIASWRSSEIWRFEAIYVGAGRVSESGVVAKAIEILERRGSSSRAIDSRESVRRVRRLSTLNSFAQCWTRVWMATIDPWWRPTAFFFYLVLPFEMMMSDVAPWTRTREQRQGRATSKASPISSRAPIARKRLTAASKIKSRCPSGYSWRSCSDAFPRWVMRYSV